MTSGSSVGLPATARSSDDQPATERNSGVLLATLYKAAYWRLAGGFGIPLEIRVCGTACAELAAAGFPGRLRWVVTISALDQPFR